MSNQVSSILESEPGKDIDVAQWALHRAVRHGSVEVITYLLDHRRASLDEIRPSLLAAVPSIALLETALSHDYDINTTESQGVSVGQRLLQHVLDDEALVRWCLNHGASVKDGVSGPDRLPPPALLDTAAASSTISTFKLLKERGAKPGKRMLHFAVASAAGATGDEDRLSRKTEMVRYLVEEEGCDVNALDTEKPLPMHFGTPIAYAARGPEGGKEVVAYLLGKGADPRIKDCWGGHNALSAAEVHGNEEVAGLLRQWLQQQENSGRPG